jgi:hypothetical protein
MFGKLLGKAIEITTLPLDVVNIGMDHLCGGDGSKKSRTEDSPFGLFEEIRDSIVDHVEKIDE